MITEREMLVTLATMAIRMDDLTGDDILESLKELGHGHIVTVARDSMRCVSSNEATPATRQHRKPCGDCPWRRKSVKGWLGDTSVEQWLLSAHFESRIDCHTLTGAQCAGAAIYRSNVCKVPRDKTLLKIAANRRLVFAMPQEFREHHVLEKKK